MSDEPLPARIRLWPALLLTAVGAFCVFGLPLLFTRTIVHFMGMMGGPVLCAVGLLAWWAFGSRVRGTYRWLPVVLFLAGAVGVPVLLHPPEVAPLAVVYGVSSVALLWVLWLVLSTPLSMAERLPGVVATVVIGWAAFALVRIDGTDADMVPDLSFRFTKTAEQLAEEERAARGQGPAVAASDAVVVRPGDWAEFRGPNRDGRAVGTTVRTDWDANPPTVVWKQRIGPGWGSFAVVGDRLFTQEQRGDTEAVVCYRADTGRELWAHQEPARFYEAIAGAGPRATPTVADGRVYAYGATGTLACLDATTGRPRWTRDVAADTGAPVPQWGFSSSPLVVQGVVVVFAGAPGGKGTAAYRADTGEPAWTAGTGTHGYASAHRATLRGVEQVLMSSNAGLESFRPADGKVLWTLPGTDPMANRVTQPAVLSDTDVLFGTGVGSDQNTKRLRVAKDGDNWSVETVWTSPAVKPYFNDGVLHKDHYYGFNGSALVCMSAADGRQRWKAGTVYGNGQVLLLADQDLLVVQAESGRVALVEAIPDDYSEVARFPALKGKTWNHPVVVRGRLYVRNGEEAACYDVSGR